MPTVFGCSLPSSIRASAWSGERTNTWSRSSLASANSSWSYFTRASSYLAAPRRYLLPERIRRSSRSLARSYCLVRRSTAAILISASSLARVPLNSLAAAIEVYWARARGNSRLVKETSA